MSCDYCKPHADPRKQRLCHEGERLFQAFRDASVRYINLYGMRDRPEASVVMAREERQKAREAYDAHIKGE